MKYVVVLVALTVGTQSHAANFMANGIPSCEIYTLYLEHPDALTAEVRLKLALVGAVAEATGLPRGSFNSDFAKLCREQPKLAPDEAIKMIFERYRSL